MSRISEIDKAYRFVNSIVSDLTFHPDWTIHLEDIRYCYTNDCIPLIITSPKQLDSVTGQEGAHTSGVFQFDPREVNHSNDRELVIQMALKTFENLYVHEVYEWLKYKGKHVKEPHPERKDQKLRD